MRISLLIAFLILSGLFFSPVFVRAGYDCYVNDGADSGGDGSKDKPYTKISKALNEVCSEIYVEDGTYADAITLGKNVEIKGSDRNDVVITGKVTMSDGSKMEDVSISGGGVYIDKDADAKIMDSIIKKSSTGVETYGGGKLIVEGTKIYDNGKGFYVQAGKYISITSSGVYNNSEEGIDIRANVDGIISGNIIEDNGESGIEVILGKAELTISNNKIKNNGSSGVATQFYEHADKIGDLKINNNTISGNKNFAVDCKLPSGGSPGKEYWTNSLTLIGNNISENKNGDFSPTCKLGTLKIDNATKTEEELEAEKKAKEEALAKYKAVPGETLGKIKILQTDSGQLNLREGPAISYIIVSTVKTGDEYDYSEIENDWYKITVNKDVWGWVSGDFAEKVIEENNVQQEEEKEVVLDVVSEESTVEEVQDDSQTEEDGDKIVRGAVIVALISFLIFLFSPISDKIFKKKKEIIISSVGKDKKNIDNL